MEDGQNGVGEAVGESILDWTGSQQSDRDLNNLIALLKEAEMRQCLGMVWYQLIWPLDDYPCIPTPGLPAPSYPAASLDGSLAHIAVSGTCLSYEHCLIFRSVWPHPRMWLSHTRTPTI